MLQCHPWISPWMLQCHGPSKVLALFAQLAGNFFACSCHIGTLYLLIIQLSSASSLKFFKYHVPNQPDLYLFLIGTLYISIIAIVHSLIALSKIVKITKVVQLLSSASDCSVE